MKWKTLIVDDEPLARMVIKDYLSDIKDFEIIGECKSAIEAGDFLNEHPVDVLFLDVNMPKLTGIQLLKNLSNPPLVIFTTAYAEFAVDAFELEAFDYLMKPIAFDRFIRTIQKTKKQLQQQSTPLNLASTLTIKEGKRIYKLEMDDIFLLQAYGDYVRLHTKEKVYITKDRLLKIKEELSDIFLQVHRSYIINLNYLKYLEGNMVMVDKEKVPVSGSYRETLLEYL